MKLFLDTANLAAIRRAQATGLLDGVTTNPSHLAKAGQVFEDVAIESDRLIQDTMTIKRAYNFTSELLAGSVKTQPTLLTCLRAGVDIATLPEDLFDQLFQHPRTELGLAQFDRDWTLVKTRQSNCTIL
jgi:transaldolase